MRPRCVIGVLLVGVCGPSALGLGETMIADFEWTIDALLTTTGQPAPPINMQQSAFFVSDDPGAGLTDPVMGGPTLGDGGSGSLDLTPLTEPLWFSHFENSFRTAFSLDRPRMTMNATIDGGVTVDDSFLSDIALDERLTPAEGAALETADIQFFRFIVHDLTIVNGLDGAPHMGTFVASGSFEVWIPSPGAGVLMAAAAIPSLVRRRR